MLPYGSQNIDDQDIDAVVSVLRGRWLTQGPAVESFENAVADYVGAEFAVAFSSGTAALHGAAWAAGLGTGDTVCTPALTFIATVNAARYTGASPRLLDVDRQNWNLDLTQVSEDADAMIPVHYAGLPLDLRPEKLKIRPSVIIEDAAHALGALTPDGPVGSCSNSDLVCFSFHPVKPITTGEGGMVTTNNSELASRLRRFRSHGIVRKPEHGEWHYEISEIGYHYRMTDIQAALGLSQLAKIDRFIGRRNEIASFYRDRLRNLPVGLPPAAPSEFLHGYHLFPVLVERRKKVFDHMRSRGIGVQVHYVPVHHHPTGSDLEVNKNGLHHTDWLYERLISLPIHPGVSEEDLKFVVETLEEAMDSIY